MLGTLNADISKILGGALSQEVGKILDTFAANSELIENNFISLRKKRIYDNHDEVFEMKPLKKSLK